MAAFSFPDSRAGRLGRFIGRLSRSRFFVISVALHFILVMTGGSVVLFKTVGQHTDVDEESTAGLVAPQAPPATEAIQPIAQPTDPTLNQPVAAPATASLTALASQATTNTAFSLPASTLDTPPSLARTFSPQAFSTGPSVAAPRPNEIPTAQARQMVKFTGDWAKSGEAGSGVNKSRSFKFTAYLAKYAGGDWNSTVESAPDGKIVKGSLPNLLYLLRQWSHDKIDAEPDPVPLELASDEIFAKKPPFILFTGHRDFVLTDREVDNLRKYLQLGGCIWGDSSLPGNRSRFDLAFRREMKRILPDQDINWEALPPDHPLYTSGKTYYPEINAPPPGMNYYQEPVYVLKNFGEISVLYTANDYCDMMQVALTDKGEVDLRKDENDHYVVTNNGIYGRREIYFRNAEVKPVTDSYKFSTNIILHLLTRWEDKLRNVPTGL